MLILNLKKKYPFECKCGAKYKVGPSIMQGGFQINHGRITCPKCKEHVYVKINSKSTKMSLNPKNSINRLPKTCYRKATKAEEKLLSKQKS